jgi:uncharacterized cysteine cluster protein YcgN (CxxCxxCC family)
MTRKTATRSADKAAAAPRRRSGARTASPPAPFWKTKTLAQMSEAEWESLCDGCGKCCLIGLEDADTGEIYLTDVACKLLDGDTCRCANYAARKTIVKDCVKLTPKNVARYKWIPKTCAYRLLAEGRDLFDWHPLVSGDPESVHRANVSVRGKTRPEGRLRMAGLMRRITKWPEPGELADEDEG